MAIEKLSDDADSFPTLEVEYEDLLLLGYKADARFGSGFIDCLGVVLEVFKRAGLGMPDPKSSGRTAFDFSQLFESVSTPDTLYDVISSDRKYHIAVVVRTGVAVSAEERVGVTARATKVFDRLPNVKYWRIKSDSLP